MWCIKVVYQEGSVSNTVGLYEVHKSRKNQLIASIRKNRALWGPYKVVKRGQKDNQCNG